MFDLFKKKKSSGGWPPPGETDGRQQDCINSHDVSDSSPPDPQKIKDAIRRKYAEVAISSEGKFEYLTGRAGAEALGYDPVFIHEAPASLLKSFCGVGNPFSLGDIQHENNDSLDDIFIFKRLLEPAPDFITFCFFTR